jgi:hypothetical protein
MREAKSTGTGRTLSEMSLRSLPFNDRYHSYDILTTVLPIYHPSTSDSPEHIYTEIALIWWIILARIPETDSKPLNYMVPDKACLVFGHPPILAGLGWFENCNYVPRTIGLFPNRGHIYVIETFRYYIPVITFPTVFSWSSCKCIIWGIKGVGISRSQSLRELYVVAKGLMVP